MNNDENPIIQSAPQQVSGRSREEVLAQLRQRLMQGGHATLKQEYGTPRRGIETGLDAAFVVDQATRDALVQADPASAALLNPYANSDDILRWRVEPQAHWLINTPPGVVNIDEYPAIKQHLLQFKPQLEKRGSSQQWFELSNAHHVDPAQIADLKIVYRDNSDWPRFTLDKSGTYYSDSGFYIPGGDYFISGLLNSQIYWFLLKSMTATGDGGFIDLLPEHIETLPIPVPEMEQRGMIGGFSDFCHSTIAEREDLYAHVSREIATHLAPGGTIAELSPVLANWHILDIDVLRAEAKRHFGKDIPEDAVQMWDDFLQEARSQFNIFNADIAQAERKLDMVVYQMFELTEEEIEHMDNI